MGKEKRRREAVLRQQPLQQAPAPEPSPVFQVRASQFSGPLPPPNILSDYNNAFPGCAERIVAMAEANSQHRRGIEQRVIDGNVSAQARGQWLAFVLGLAMIGGGTALVALGSTAIGASMVLGNATAMVSVFLYGRLRQERERREKAGLPAPGPGLGQVKGDGDRKRLS